MDKLLGAMGLTAIAGLIAVGIVGAVISELNKRYVQSQKPVVLWSILATLVLVGGLVTLLENPIRDAWLRASGRLAFDGSRSVGPPVVIGIYPDKAFGPLHRDGLNSAIAKDPSLQVVNLIAPLEAMKTGKADDLLRQLRTQITTRNVVAVVGPPVTEFTGPVIRAVWQTGRKPPVFITSAAPREPVGWDGAGISLFRVNSGVDERIDEFLELANASIAKGVPLSFLVEQSENSGEKLYGQLVFDAIVAKLPLWDEWMAQRKISVTYYTRGDITGERVKSQLDRLTAQPRIIMLLGTGGDYMAVADAFYKAGEPPRAAMLGGWMNAYDAHSKFSSAPYQWNRLFEITDVDIEPSRPRSPDDAHFASLFGELSPAVRDQAFSYDAGIIVADAFRAVRAERRLTGKPVRADGDYLRRMVDRIRRSDRIGVTGPIRFDPKLGQNVAGRGTQSGLMTYAAFDGGGRWSRLGGPGEVVKRALAPPPAPAALAAADRNDR